MMKHPQQHSRMLNGGFCGIVLALLVQGSGRGRGVSLTAAYLLVPMLLHPYTAERVARARDDSLSELVRLHPRIILDLDRRITIAAPSIRAGMTLALRRGVLRLDREAREFVMSGVLDLSRLREILEPDDHVHVDAALKLGRWAAQMSVVQICTSTLIRPMFRAPSSLTLAQDSIGRNA